MRFVERVRSEFLPVGPDFLQYFRVVAVLLAARNEFGLEVVQLVLEFLTHGLTQRVRLAAGEIGQ